MSAEDSAARRILLVELEGILGREFYNSRTRNYGPGGVRESDGRSLRYPISFRMKDGTTVSRRDPVIGDAGLSAEEFMTGHYAVGANRLDVMRALDKVLRHLV